MLKANAMKMAPKRAAVSRVPAVAVVLPFPGAAVSRVPAVGVVLFPGAAVFWVPAG